MAMIHDKTMRVGAYGWEHEHWQGSFYPQDLPEDWRLGYYANMFTSVLVPEAKWSASNADFVQWEEDVHDDFRFYFLLDEGLKKATVGRESKKNKQIAEIMGNKFAGYVSATDDNIQVVSYRSKHLREWKTWLIGAECESIFLNDQLLLIEELSNFKSLIEMLGL